MNDKQKALLKKAKEIIRESEEPCSCGSIGCSYKCDEHQIGWAEGVIAALENCNEN